MPELAEDTLRLLPLPSFSPARVTALAFAALAFAVLAFSGGWTDGRLVLDGAGVSMWLRLALDHLRTGQIPYWLPDMWAGAPAWVLVPSFSTFTLLPFAAVLGPETAVKVASLAFQIAGAWGAFVLARSLWGRHTPAPLVAGFLYGLHPLVLSHTALFGQHATTAVLGATPWLAWSFIRAVRGDGPQHVAIAGLLVGFVLIEQAEHAYALAVLCALLLVLELTRTRGRGRGRLGIDGVLVRAGAVVVIGVGAVAYWLLPFLSLTKSFVLSPPDLVRDFLLLNPLSQEPGAFLRRAAAIAVPVSFARTDILNGPFYLSWVCVILGSVGAVMAGRRDRDRRLTVILCASAVGLWMSTGATALAASGPARRGQVIFFLAIGLASGLLVGSFLRLFRVRRTALVGGGAAVLLVALPYLTPFLALQRWIPLLSSIRFPRFYPLAALGVTLAAAYPITLVQQWARRRRPSMAVMLSWAVSVAVMAIFVVDINPYRSYYHLRRADASAFDAVTPTLASTGAQYRVATDNYATPEDVAVLLNAGSQLSVGWPHPIASKDLWPITVKALSGPVGYRDRALGLSSTKYVVKEDLNPPDETSSVLERVRLEENPLVLPLVRTYEQAAVVADAGIAPILATDLAYKNVVTVTGRPQTAAVLGGVPTEVLSPPDACAGVRTGSVPARLAGDLVLACGLRTWVDGDAGAIDLGDTGSGGTFVADMDGLQGISVRLDRLPGPAELVVREVGPDGRSLGPEVARAKAAGVDENELADFRFPPIVGAIGRRYAFVLSCPGCSDSDAPRLLRARPPASGPGDLIADGQLQPQYDAQFTLRYQRMPAAPVSSTSATGTRRGPGKWAVQTSGQKPAVLVVGDSYFPGWRAKVDGKPTPVVEADGAFLGVAVAAGQHTVTLEYHKPASVTVGRIVTALTLLGALILLTAPGRRRRRRHRRSGRLGTPDPSFPPAGARTSRAARRHRRSPGRPRPLPRSRRRPTGEAVASAAVSRPVGARPAAVPSPSSSMSPSSSPGDS